MSSAVASDRPAKRDEGAAAAAKRGLPRLRPRVAWMTMLFVAICFEGLGRKFIPSVPSIVFYFLKDVVLLGGLVAYGTRASVLRTARSLYGYFLPVLVAAVAWTVLEMFNPQEASIVLGLIGLRSYWLWWLAPLVIGSALEDVRDYRRVVVALAIVAGIVSVFAALQFVRPTDDPLNAYAQHEGEETMDVAVVAETGRARVSATFSYITGFTDFVILVPPMLLSIGLKQSGRVRLLALLGTFASAAVAPTAGSRSPMVLGAITLLAVAWGAGLLKTSMGRRALAGGAVAVVVAAIALPQAMEGVQSRFSDDTEETRGRFLEPLLDAIPPVAMSIHDYEPLGRGTGMQHNSRIQFGVAWLPTDREGEVPRILAELGPIGYLLVWTARLGLTIALFKASARFKRAGEGGFRGLAIAYALLVNVEFLVTDHVFSSLFFVGVGLLLRAAVACQPAATVAPTKALRGWRRASNMMATR